MVVHATRGQEEDPKEKAKQEVELCLTAIEQAAGADLEFAEGVRDTLTKRALPKFVEHLGAWDNNKTKVLAAAGAIGKIARVLTDIIEPKPKVLEQKVVDGAIALVKEHCTAGLKLAWCPDLPAPEKRRGAVGRR